MDRRTFLVAGAGALVLAACSSKTEAASDDPKLTSSTTDAPTTTAATTTPTTATTVAPTTAAATTAAPAAAAVASPAPARAHSAGNTPDAGANDNPTGITSPPNAHAAETEVRLGSIAVPKLGLNTTLFEGVTLTTLNKVGVG